MHLSFSYSDFYNHISIESIQYDQLMSEWLYLRILMSYFKLIYFRIIFLFLFIFNQQTFRHATENINHRPTKKKKSITSLSPAFPYLTCGVSAQLLPLLLWQSARDTMKASGTVRKPHIYWFKCILHGSFWKNIVE